MTLMESFIQSLTPELMEVAASYPGGCFDLVVEQGDGDKVKRLLELYLEFGGE